MGAEEQPRETGGGLQAQGSVGGGRFQLLRRLGDGGYGVVYEALDHERGLRVALKVLSRIEPDALLRFKREFRAFSDLSHPNLVRLDELGEDAGAWYVSMELLDGADFLTTVRPGGRLDVGRLRRALPQLVAGVAALHRAGMIHRDIKPSNVWITEQGRVVLLDFGLVSEKLDGQGSVTVPVGTIAYMSPEQAACAGISPASDWYGVGSVLFEALTGKWPFSGGAVQVLLKKQREQAPHVRDVAPEAPADLAELCEALLARDPAARPGLDSIAKRLDAQEITTLPPPPQVEEVSFVGRIAELDDLRRCFDETAGRTQAVVVIEGEAGVGKTELVGEFVQRCAPPDEALLLKSRCHEQETVPFKAIDGLVDALTQHLRTLSARECSALLPENIHALCSVFPVLRRVPEVARSALRSDEVVDPLRVRDRGLSALRELLGRCAEHGPLVVVIGDVHWADRESLAVLEELWRPPRPAPILWLFTVRPSGGDPGVRDGFERVLGLCEDVRRIRLGPLSEDEAARLCGRVFGRDPVLSKTVARESHGSPLLIATWARVARRPGVSLESLHELDDVLQALCDSLSVEQKVLLRLLYIAGGPQPQLPLARACGLSPASVDGLLASLRAERIVRRAAGDRYRWELVYPRLGEVALAQLSQAEVRELHLQLARELLAEPEPDAETLARLYAGAGDTRRAAESAVRAARAAHRAYAFDKAARLFELALGWPDAELERSQLLRELADAHLAAGRGLVAAEHYMEAAGQAEPSLRLELHRRAAEGLLQSGELDDGIHVASLVLTAVGEHMPPPGGRAVVRGLRDSFARLWLPSEFEPRPAAEVPPDLLQRVDMLAALAPALGPVDPLRAFALQAAQYRHALVTREPARVSRAMSMNTWGRYFSGRTRGISAQLSRARELAELADDELAMALVEFFESMMRGLLEGDLLGCRSGLDRAERRLAERCRGVTWFVSNVQSSELAWAILAGDVGMVTRELPRWLREAKERGHRFAYSQNLLYAGWYYHLARDDVDAARDALREALQLWPRGERGPEQLLRCHAEAGLALYADDVDGMTEAVRFLLSLDRGGLLSRGIGAMPLWSALATLSYRLHELGVLDEAQLSRRLVLANKGLSRKSLPEPLTAPRAALVRALHATRSGDDSEAARAAREACRGFEAIGCALHAGLARLTAENMEPPAAEVRELLWSMRRAGVRAPARFARVLGVATAATWLEGAAGDTVRGVW